MAFAACGLTVDSGIVASWNGKSAMSCRKYILETFHDKNLYETLYQIREDHIYEALEKGELHLLPYVREVLAGLKEEGARSHWLQAAGKKERWRSLKKQAFSICLMLSSPRMM